MKQNLAISFIISFFVGIIFRQLFSLGGYFIVFVFFLAGLGFVFLLFGAGKGKVPLLFISLVALGFSIGVARFHFSKLPAGGDFTKLRGTEVSVIGKVAGEPEEKNSTNRFFLKPTEYSGKNFATTTYPGGEFILVAVPLHEKVIYGDNLFVTGKLEKVGVIKNDGVVEADFSKFYEKDAVFESIPFAKISVLSHSPSVLEKLLRFRNTFLVNTARVIPEPEQSLVAGIILGAKDSLPKKAIEEFRLTGLSHIIVLSGYNVSVVADFFVKLSSFLPGGLSFMAGVFGIVVFGVMAGGGATVFRAVLMVSVALFARHFGKTHDAVAALFLSGFVIAFYNPKIFLIDPSFHLSFIATFGLLVGAPIFENVFSSKLPKTLRDILSATISTQIFVAPYLLYLVGSVSIISLLSNLAVLPVVPFLMAFGFAAGLLGFISFYASLIFGGLAYFLLKYVFIAAGVFSKFPFAQASLNLSFPLMLFAYLLLLLVVYVLSRRLVSDKESQK